MASFILLISVLILSVCHLGDKFILGLLLEMLKVLILWVFKVVEETVFAACVCAELLKRVEFGLLCVCPFVAQITVLKDVLAT